ncbi:MAG TPA: type VI secretion system baseplate subunit TssG [Rubrivivax sp.]|nr:type VI secretion system baseplate subunit TssG [Rubrivivax sp.]
MTTPADSQAEFQTLLAAVEAEPWAYDFFALLRRTEALLAQAPRMGQASRPSQEAIRLGQEPELDFAPAALARLDLASARPRLGVRFFGLLGPHGPMPLHFTEYVRDRARNHADATLARFLDMFHHRLLSLFYRAWAHTQPVVHRDRPAEDRYAAWLGATVGRDASTHGRHALPETAKLYQAGLLGGRSRHAEGLTKLLQQHFRVPVRVVQNVGQWLELQDEDRGHLGTSSGRSTALRLGRTANIGSKVWDRQYTFRIVLGPMTLEQYEGFLPGQQGWRELNEWVTLYAGMDKRWDVELCLAAAEVPAPRLGRHLRLGLISWAGAGRRPARDRSDLRLRSTLNPLPSTG